MKINACSVAFRHMNITAGFLADYTREAGFDGLEIWAPHARAMAADWARLPWRPRVPMLAGYLPLGEDGFRLEEARALCALTQSWGAGRLRLFAGTAGSALASPALRARIIADLRACAGLAQDHGLRVAVETHPGTLADTPAATHALLAEAAHPALGLNFDVLHVWEAGADPLAAFQALAPHVLHFHLKSVTSRAGLAVFSPANIHDPQGSRDGICPLFRGALDYAAILKRLPALAEGSLEWFGPAPAQVMQEDLAQIRAISHLSARR
ncbi:MAG: sugar phosphate isomerase/epimerase [Gemmobacter sp.]|uniref:sugar phosphate isomerase/epimerase family protein n=1 Tax=Gemmobacter sp. TaxID=1898957 RepID=UPI001A415672|nr:sugar phosphate isomerase/epimerase family protein [Gemmobacter sp.]MBL8561904.1 sugar phosphate isomerase/epimerase [Gemmobacter sp.]